jgi:predicted ABC-type ATPase
VSPDPQALIFAGPNGSGKSTLTSQVRRGDFPGITFPNFYINADEIAVTLRASGALDPERAAFFEGRRLRQTYREERRSFAYETVLSHPSGILDLIRLSEAGYQVTLVVVTTRDPRLNVERVRRRVLSGGHDVPEDRIIARHQRCMELLPRAIETATDAWIFDSTARLRLAVECRGGTVTDREKPPRYMSSRLIRPLRERQAGRAHVGDLLSVKTIQADENAGAYAGLICWLGQHYLVQECSGQGPILHDRCMLTGTVSVGAQAQITYREGAGAILLI